MPEELEILKNSGKSQFFDRNKFCNSLKKAGADDDLVDQVCSSVEREVHTGMSTDMIFQKATAYLSRRNIAVAARYNLKQAIMDLGPAGFIFEQYLERILLEYGYKTRRNHIMKGHCVSHEVDILAEKDRAHYFVELKYRNRRDLKVDLSDAMYLYARYLDLERERNKKEGGEFSHKSWLITNTKFTTKVISYSKCMGIKLLGWNYPKGGGLERVIEKKGLYPVTVLPSLNRYARERFAEAGIMFARDLLGTSKEDLRKKFAIYPDLAEELIKEVETLYHGEK